jgi:hypothetical protein
MRSLVSLTTLLVAAQAWAAAPQREPEPRTARLARAMKLWGAVRWHHPWLLTRTLDWDAALVRALPRVAAAEAASAEREALAALLAELGDPATRLDEAAPSAPPAPASAGAAGAIIEQLPGNVWSVQLVQHPSFDAAEAEAAKLAPQLASAKAVVLDLRDQPPVVLGVEDVGDELELLARELAPTTLQTPSQRTVFYSGYPPQVGGTSGGYSLVVTFTGHDVRHAEGRQLQRVGLQPQVLVRPTAAGLRAGRDEVLERALKELESPRK